MSSSEDEDYDDKSDDSEDQVKFSKRKSKSSGSHGSGSKKRKSSSKYNSLLDDEAGEEEDEDEERDEIQQLTQMELDAHERVRRRQEAERQMTAEEYAANIEARYRRQAGPSVARAANDDYSDNEGYSDNEEIEAGYGASTEVAQQSLLPSITDPKLFMIKCKPGTEQIMVLSLMNKAMAFDQQGKSLGIMSIIASGTKGYIYLEANHEPAIREAIKGLRNLYQGTLAMVPIKEMTSILTTQIRRMPLEEGQYVRLTRFPYKDDLARVERVINYGEKAVVQFIPRLDLSLLNLTKEERKARKKLRPSQKWFDSVEVKQAGGHIERKKFSSSGDYMDSFEGGFYRNGFAFKEVSVSTAIRTSDINPSLEELTKFRSRLDKKINDLSDDSENDDELLTGKTKGSSQMDVIAELRSIQAKEGPRKDEVPLFAMNDVVVVTSGDLKDLKGRVVEVSGTGPSSTIRVRPLDIQMASNIVTLHPHQIVKYFDIGAHVRVMEGIFCGETGTIVKLKDGENSDMIAVVLADLTSKEIQVRVAHIQESMEVAQGLDSLGGIEYGDLIMISTTDVAMVISVGRDDVETVTSSGAIKRVKPEESRGNRNIQSARTVVNDAENTPIKCGNDVTIIEGKYARQTGTIKHIYRTTLWLHNSKLSANRGIFVARARSCVLSGKRADIQTTSAGYMGSVQNSQDKMIRDFRNRSDEMLGKTVKLIKGQFKGHMGIVVEATDTHVKVEMATRHKKITVERAKVKVVGDRNGAFDGDSTTRESDSSFLKTPVRANQTPLYAAQTPLHTEMTPSHGAMTPARNIWQAGSVSTTPAYDPNASSERGGGYSEWPEPAKDSNWGEAVQSDNSVPAQWGASPVRTNETNSLKDQISKSDFGGWGANASPMQQNSSTMNPSNSPTVGSWEGQKSSNSGWDASAPAAAPSSNKSGSWEPSSFQGSWESSVPNTNAQASSWEVPAPKQPSGWGGASETMNNSPFHQQPTVPGNLSSDNNWQHNTIPQNTNYSSPHPTSGGSFGGEMNPAWVRNGALVVHKSSSVSGTIIESRGTSIKVRFNDGRVVEDNIDSFHPGTPRKGSKVQVFNGEHAGKEGKVRRIDNGDAHLKTGVGNLIVKLHELVEIT